MSCQLWECGLPRFTVLRDQREALAAQVQARLDRLRALAFEEPTDEERARNQFVNVDLPLHLPGDKP